MLLLRVGVVLVVFAGTLIVGTVQTAVHVNNEIILLYTSLYSLGTLMLSRIDE